MAGANQPPNGAKQQNNTGGKKEVKILMLHGYTQSGPLFKAKTRALEKVLVKLLAPISLLPVLSYPTAPNRLKPTDIPGYVPPEDEDEDEDDGGYELDTWGWYRKDEASGEFIYMDEGMATIADAIRDMGGVDAICGFSQGGAMAALAAAALEPDRVLPEGKEGSWAQGLRDANGGKPVKFAVSYSGYFAPPKAFNWCYEPKIKTPILNFLGSLDTVVDEDRSQGLVDRCQDPVKVVHPGGHHVPISKEWAMPLAGFIKQYTQS